MLIADYLEGKKRVGVMGLGYVGLPLLLAFEKHFSMVGFDVSRSKIDALINGVDETHEVGDEALSLSNSLSPVIQPNYLAVTPSLWRCLRLLMSLRHQTLSP